MTQQPSAKTPEQALEEQSNAKKRPYTKPTLKKLEMKPETPSEEFADLTGSKP
jgi:hypothetical protein